MRVAPDDDVFRINAVFLGPTGWTLPWTARYVAYGVGFALFFLILLVEAILPFKGVGVPPVWEVCFAILGTYGVMAVVDHDRPLKSVWHTGRIEAGTAVRALRARRTPGQVHLVARVKIGAPRC